LVDQFTDGIGLESTSVLLAEFELHLQPSIMRQRDDLTCWKGHVGKAFAAFNSRHSHVGTKIEVGGQLCLRDCDLKGTASSHGRYLMESGRGDLSSDYVLVRH